MLKYHPNVELNEGTQMAEKGAQIIFYGRVQGVFFRANTQREASRLGVTGWVRNMSDGNVEALFEGEETKVKELVQFCKHKIPMANVTYTKIDWKEPTLAFEGFEVRR